MKLVQKTILATAVAVALAPSAFAEVTLSGKATAEVVGVINEANVKDVNGINKEDDGLEFTLAGEYDIIGGNTAGFEITADLAKGTWSNGSLNHDAAYIFVKTGAGTFLAGRLDAPTDGIKTDYWSNSSNSVAGTGDGDLTKPLQGHYYVGVGGSHDNAIAYANSFGNLDFAVAMVESVAGNNSTLVEDGNDFIYDAAVAFNLEAVKLEAGVQHTPKRAGNDANTDFILGADFNNFTATVTSTLDNEATSVLLGGKHAFTDVITGKATISALSTDDFTNIKVAAGADYQLAKNIVAHTVVDFKQPDGDDVETQIDVAAGITVKF